MLKPSRTLKAVSWSSTLHLPKNSFPLRPLQSKHPDYLKRCTDDLYARQAVERVKQPTFTLHDGPPYANGDLHIGHALNKILKDIFCRFQLSQGKRVHFVPGWDCHGLPIEIKALQEPENQLSEAGPVAVREAARKLATSTVEKQKQGFKEWAIMGDWDQAYRSMDHAFEVRQLRVFKDMVGKGKVCSMALLTGLLDSIIVNPVPFTYIFPFATDRFPEHRLDQTRIQASLLVSLFSHCTGRSRARV